MSKSRSHCIQVLAAAAALSALAQPGAYSAGVQNATDGAEQLNTAAPAAAIPAPAGTTVVDSKGKIVGPLLSAGLVLLQVNGAWTGIYITKSGISAGFAAYYFTSANCTGTKYFSDYVDKKDAIPPIASFIKDLPPSNKIWQVIPDPAKMLQYNSVSYYDTLSKKVVCQEGGPPFPQLLYTFKLKDAPILGTPPFSLK